MLPLAALGPWGPAISGVVSFATSRLGSSIIVGLLAYGYGDYRTNRAWELKQAAQEASLRQAHAEELAREANAAKDIAAAATARAEDDTALAANLNDQIEQLKAKETLERKHHVPAALSCSLDDDRIERVRRFDAASHHRTPTPPRRPSSFR